MREEFMISIVGPTGKRIRLDKSFETYRQAQDYWEEFWGGPDYVIMRRVIGDWEEL